MTPTKEAADERKEGQNEQELIEVKPISQGFPVSDYDGAFPMKVERQIKMLAGSPCLHLFSGSSKIGDERVDFAHPNATIKGDVIEFLKHDDRQWKWVVIDPPYKIDNAAKKLSDYQDYTAISASIPKRDAICSYLKGHAENILWLDRVSPLVWGFYRKKVWLFIHLNGWNNVRVLTWLARQGERLQ